MWFQYGLNLMGKSSGFQRRQRQRRSNTSGKINESLIIDSYAKPISKFNITQVMVKREAELVKDHDLETNPSR